MYIRSISSLRALSIPPAVREHPKLLFATLLLFSFGLLFASFSLLNRAWSKKITVTAAAFIKQIQEHKQIQISKNKPLYILLKEIDIDLPDFSNMDPEKQLTNLFYRLLFTTNLELASPSPLKLKLSFDKVNMGITIEAEEDTMLTFKPFTKQLVNINLLFKQMVMRKKESFSLNKEQILFFRLHDSDPLNQKDVLTSEDYLNFIRSKQPEGYRVTLSNDILILVITHKQIKYLQMNSLAGFSIQLKKIPSTDNNN